MWSRDGEELFYRNGEALMAVPVDTTGTTFVQGNPTVVFEDQYMVDAGGPRFPMTADIIAHYDISPIDGRFLMIKEVEEASEVVRIIVVQNWLEELRLLAPVE